MSYIKVDVPKPGNNAGRGLNTQDRIIIFDMDDVLSFPSRDDKGVVMVGDIVLKPNAYAINIYATPDKIELTSNTEGDIDNEGFIPSVKFSHPGNEQEIREFKTNWLGRNAGIMIVRCDSNIIDLFGKQCTPMRMQAAYTGNKDANSSEITFTQARKGDDMGIYKGTIPFAEPVAVVPAGATSITLVGSGQYQITGNSTTDVIAAATGAADGMVFTLLGVTSGTPPTVESNAVFTLKNGETWTAATGSQITFLAYKSAPADGGFIFIEQSRYS